MCVHMLLWLCLCPQLCYCLVPVNSGLIFFWRSFEWDISRFRFIFTHPTLHLLASEVVVLLHRLQCLIPPMQTCQGWCGHESFQSCLEDDPIEMLVYLLANIHHRETAPCYYSFWTQRFGNLVLPTRGCYLSPKQSHTLLPYILTNGQCRRWTLQNICNVGGHRAICCWKCQGVFCFMNMTVLYYGIVFTYDVLVSSGASNNFARKFPCRCWRGHWKPRWIPFSFGTWYNTSHVVLQGHDHKWTGTLAFPRWTKALIW